MPCCRAMCRIFGFLPDFIISSAAVLSWKTASATVLSESTPHRSSIGSASFFIPVSAATSSDSAEACDTAVCFVEIATNGKSVCGPTRAKKTPDVDFFESLQLAKSASVYRRSSQCCSSSPHETRHEDFVIGGVDVANEHV